jgi:hypothetical protein
VIVADERAEGVQSDMVGFDTLGIDGVAKVFGVDNGCGVFVERGEYRARDAARREHALPVVDAETFDPAHGDGGHFRQQAAAFGMGHAEQRQASRLHMRHHAGVGGERQIGFATDQAGDGGAAALVRPMGEIDAGAGLEYC